MLRPRLRIPRAGGLLRRPIQSTLFCRNIHKAPVLSHFRPEEGVPGLLSDGGFDMAWTQYMRLMMEKLNAQVAGTDYEQQDTLTILKATARDPALAPTFNHASMAHNNHFFFENLVRVDPEAADEYDNDTTIPAKLRSDLEANFSSIETLRREFLSIAMAMFGPGFVWLVKNARSTELRILTTYLAGTPYTAGHWRRQPHDMNNQGFGESSGTVKQWLELKQAGAGADTGGKFNSQAPGGTDVIPLLCLNTWEHVWLRDYGMGAGGVGGKRLFVENWWQRIDWNKVGNLASIQKDKFK